MFVNVDYTAEKTSITLLTASYTLICFIKVAYYTV